VGGHIFKETSTRLPSIRGHSRRVTLHDTIAPRTPVQATTTNQLALEVKGRRLGRKVAGRTGMKVMATTVTMVTLTGTTETTIIPVMMVTTRKITVWRGMTTRGTTQAQTRWMTTRTRTSALVNLLSQVTPSVVEQHR